MVPAPVTLPLGPVRRRLVEEYSAMTGPHNELEIYGAPPGDPGLIGPGSVSWEIHADVAATFFGGLAAIVMEVLHPSVMAGVHDQSAYREQPLRRARTTHGYVIVTTFGNTNAAEGLIDRVRRMHARVSGTRPDGVAYRALDPRLIGWVHTCIPWAVMRAFERYHRPLSDAERTRYLTEQSVIGRRGGAEDIPVTAAELHDYVESMRPELEVTDQTRQFFEFLFTTSLGPRLPSPLARPAHLAHVHAAMSIMPGWARRLSGFEHSGVAQVGAFDPYLRVSARALRWAFGTPVFRAMAEERVARTAGMATNELAS